MTHFQQGFRAIPAPLGYAFDDAFGAVRYLQSMAFVRSDRIAAIGRAPGGV